MIVVVTVAESGPGVPGGNKGVIFRRSKRRRGEGSGEGPGLYTPKTPVGRYAEWIRAEDRDSGRPEDGATFRLTPRKSDCTDIETQDPGEL